MQVAGYVLGEIIGRGGFATVYRGHREGQPDDVAIKIFDRGEDGLAARQFLRESRVVADLGTHPHILGLIDVGVTPDGRPFIVTEFCEGGSLAALMSVGPVRPTRVVQYALEVCDALRVLHGAGIIHRDIKPANILIDSAGQTRLCDFGVSTVAGWTLRAHSAALTIAYAAPETLRDPTAADRRSDMYSLGATVYGLLQGAAPWDRRDSEGELRYLERISQDQFPSVTAQLVPVELLAVIATATANDPARRYRDVGELDEALRHVQQQQVTEAVRPDTATRTAPLGTAETEPGPTADTTRASPGGAASETLRAPAAAGKVRPRSSGPEAAPPPPAPPPRRPPSPTLTPTPDREINPTALALVAALGIVAAVGSGLFIAGNWRSEPTPSPTTSSEVAQLNVERSGEVLLLAWDEADRAGPYVVFAHGSGDFELVEESTGEPQRVDLGNLPIAVGETDEPRWTAPAPEPAEEYCFVVRNRDGADVTGSTCVSPDDAELAPASASSTVTSAGTTSSALPTSTTTPDSSALDESAPCTEQALSAALAPGTPYDFLCDSGWAAGGLTDPDLGGDDRAFLAVDTGGDWFEIVWGGDVDVCADPDRWGIPPEVLQRSPCMVS